ncbi:MULTISPECIES: hypothetical protein [Chryseobacterium]|uniref:DUF4276 family protein n=2 Tax=Chryseobacterium TaxID=59732 RepID=A0A3D9B9W4_9FLAO|nr:MULTISPECIES: hypothetical protein [Chryseobacterium]OVE63281.1 hypothetical protein B0E34_00405 [Chryseobacterium mucoviscidosis]REC50511.1 hypothetical protein DRF68_09445 [Candidatus Chryseobacterium massiliae]HAO05497.1 hypothetical protein [Chryseobacterium sp.]
MERVVAVECFADKYFFGKLLQNEKRIRKEKNKNEVIKAFERVKGEFLIGIVDEDRKDLLLNPNLKSFEKIKEGNSFKIYKDKTKYQFIFALCPKAFEDWLCQFLKLQSKDLIEFDYIDFESFKKETKSEQIDKESKYKNLVKHIIQTYPDFDNHIKEFKIHIDYLLTETYNFNLERFKNL